jgi:Na+-translocating ferredoxin:NAD+ oxidoreductase RNF subunit RnfB
LKELLPGIDCGACGTPSCEALAEDIVCRNASINACIFMKTRFEKQGSLSQKLSVEIMEEIWGKERFTDESEPF